MTFKASFLYALRIVRPGLKSASNGRKSLFGAVFGVAVSLVPLVVVLVVAEGMIEGITERMIGLSSYHLQVSCPPHFFKTGEEIPVLTELAQNLEKEIGARTFAERQGMALAVSKNNRSGAVIRAVPRDIFEMNKAFREYIEVLSGEAAFPSPKSAVIGKGIADKLGLNVGDKIRLITARTSERTGVVPKILLCTVSAVVSSGYEEIDALWVFLPLETGFDFLTESSSQIIIGVETDFPFSESLNEAYRSAAAFLPARFFVRRWSEINTARYENYASTKLLLILIMFLILLIAAVNISSALIMTVSERKKEIAILKSVGASSSGISTAFLCTGILCGAGGIVIGLPLALVCAVNCNEIIKFMENAVNFILKLWYLIAEGSSCTPIHLLNPEYYLQRVPVNISFREMFFIAAGTLLLSAAVSVFPAMRAGKEKPLHILRKT